MDEVTRLLEGISRGDARSAEALLPLVYDELRRLASHRLRRERPGQTLQATALVHEAYLRLVDVQRAQQWSSVGHFFAAASEAMRRILVESARRKLRLKRGGGRERSDVEIAELPTKMTSEDILALHEGLEALAREDARKARLVTMRYFGGMTEEAAAEVLGISRATAHRDWTYARAWLHARVRGSGEAP